MPVQSPEPEIIDVLPPRGQARKRSAVWIALGRLAAWAVIVPAVAMAGCRGARPDPASSLSQEGARPLPAHTGSVMTAAPPPATSDDASNAASLATVTAAAAAAIFTAEAVTTADAAGTAMAAIAATGTAVAAWTVTPAPVVEGSAAAAEAAAPPPAGAAPAAVAAGGRVSLPGAVHVYQKWNNCAPSSAVMALSVFGIARDQLAAAAELKPDGKDTNVGPDELAAYLRGQGLRSRVVFGADAATVRLLVTAGVPAIVEQWVAVEGRGEMGHYRVITGFQQGAFLAQDSYYGPNRAIDDAAFEAEWRPFGRAMVLAYRSDQERAVAAALGPLADEAAMQRAALARQEAEDTAIGDAWAHFALAEARARLGDWPGAAEAGDRAMAKGLPFRALWYQFGYYRALHALGRYDDLLALCDRTLAPMKGEQLEESHHWRGMALRGLGREDEAVAAFQAALRYNPGFVPAREALGNGQQQP